MADENKSALQESYRRDLSQARRLPRLMPAVPSQPETSTDEDDEEDGQDMSQDDFANEAENIEDTADDDAAEEEEAAAEDEEDAADDEEAAAAEEGAEEEGAEPGKISKEALEKAKQEATKKAGEAVTRLAGRLKIAKIGAALTLIGIIVTYLIMTLQFIIGNTLKKPWMPKLSMFEIILWFLLTSLLVLALAIAFVILIILIAMSLGPVVALGLLGKELINFIF